MTSQPLLEVSDLSITFPTKQGESTVVRDVNFCLERGRTIGIVGESGSGKSMTSLAIMGLLPPTARVTGSIQLDGTELIGRSEHQLRRIRGDRMSMIFQDPLSSLNPYYTVGLQIEEAYRAHRKASRRQARALAVEALERVGIRDPDTRVRHYPHQFSGGMRQRIMIAMALVNEPDLLIADEPTTALDVTVQAQILSLLAELQEQTGTGMVFITHDLAVVSQIAQDVLVMSRAEQVELGSAEQVFAEPHDHRTRELLAAIPRLDEAVDLPRPVASARSLMARQEERSA